MKYEIPPKQLFHMEAKTLSDAINRGVNIKFDIIIMIRAEKIKSKTVQMDEPNGPFSNTKLFQYIENAKGSTSTCALDVGEQVKVTRELPRPPRPSLPSRPITPSGRGNRSLCILIMRRSGRGFVQRCLRFT